jgi:6-methylsalicylate decarboxylase
MSATAQSALPASHAPRAVTRIDVHAHFLPDFYLQALIEAGESQPDGIYALPEWDEKSALRTMDTLGVRTALLSISSPGVHFGEDGRAADLARRCNNEGARLRRAHPARFGHFASLPLPDVEASVGEAVRALDELGADGVVLETNSGGLYLGDPLLKPLYIELDRRAAVIFIHPTSPACPCCARLSAAYPQPMVEFMFETTRSVADMVLSGVLDRFPNLKVIVPHAGAALPALSERIELLLPMLAKEGAPKPPSIIHALRSLHFDLAGARGRFPPRAHVGRRYRDGVARVQLRRAGRSKEHHRLGLTPVWRRRLYAKIRPDRDGLDGLHRRCPRPCPAQ